jgi:hypothetical protein
MVEDSAESDRCFRTTSSRRIPRVGSLHHRWSGCRGHIYAGFLIALIAFGFAGFPAIAMADGPVITINNEFLNDTRLTSGLLLSGPPEVAREMAIIDSAMFDAANAASGLIYGSVAYTGGAVTGVSVDAAALSAGYTALQGIFANAIWSGTGGSASIQATVLNNIGATYSSALNGLGITQPPGVACASPAGALVSVCGGIALGTTAANANLAARGYTIGNSAALAADGSSTAILNGITMPYKAPPNPPAGVYIPPNQSPGGGRVAMFPQWGIVAPSGLSTGQMAAIVAKVPGPPAVTSAAYAANLLRTECQGAGTALPSSIKNACAAAGFSPETTAEAKAALFWNDPGTTYQPPGHWLDITDNLINQQGLSTLQAARLGSLVSQAENDAGIAAWTVKYQDNLWRPVTAIRDCTNWNPYFTSCDPTWSSLIATPPHPDYLAGHPAFSGAAATVLANFLGTSDIPITSTSDTYCNVGTPLRSLTTHLIVACTVPGTSAFAFNTGNTIYTTANGCVDAGGVLGANGSLVTCTIGATTYTYNPVQSGCDDIVNGGANDSPLICPITETFATIFDASSGLNGAEFSRVVGGIHTPFAVVDALDLGNAIGQAISNENNIPEPAGIGLLAMSLGLLGSFRRHRSTRQ